MNWRPIRSTGTAALVAAFFMSSVSAAPLPTRPPGGLDPSTVVGDYTLAQIAAAAFAGGGSGTDANTVSLINAEASTARANEAVDLATAKNGVTAAAAAQAAASTAGANSAAAQASAAQAINTASTALSTAASVQAAIALAAPLSSPSLTGTPTSTTPASAVDNSTRIATTAWVTAFVAANSSSTGTGTGTGLSTAQISELNGALQAAGGDASNVLITATGTSNNRTAAALSTDELAAKALATTALQPSAVGVSVAPLTSGKIPVGYISVGTTSGTLADGGTLFAVQNTANSTQAALTAEIATVTNLVSASAPASSSASCTAPAIKTPTISGVTYLVACTTAGQWGAFTALSSAAWTSDPAAGVTTGSTGTTGTTSEISLSAPASSGTACTAPAIKTPTINGVTYIVACTQAGTWGAFTAMSSIAWTSDPAAGSVATAASTTPSLTAIAPTSSATACVPGSIANATIGSNRYLFSCGNTGELDAFTVLSSVAWTGDPMANASSSSTGTGTGTGTTTTVAATAFTEVSPTGDLVLAYPAAGNIEYVVHPPTTAMNISLNTATIHAGVPQTIYLKIMPVVASGAVTLSTTGVRWGLNDYTGNPAPPSVTTTANSITIAQYDSWGDSASTVMGH